MLALVIVLIGVPGGIYLLSQLDDDTATEDALAGDPGEDLDEEPEEDPQERDGRDDGTEDDGDDGDDPGSDPAPAPEDQVLEVEPLDLDALTGTDRLWGELLTDIDASERAMIAFQEGLSEAFGALADLDEVLDAVEEVAATQRRELLAVRDRLADPVDDAGAEQVRERYVVHLDSWEAFMAAVEEEPLVVLEQSERGFTVDINATADAFARALEEELPPDVDAEVERFAEGILDRGFRGFGTAQV